MYFKFKLILKGIREENNIDMLVLLLIEIFVF